MEYSESIKVMREVVNTYKPGKTIRGMRDERTDLPEKTNIALFGGHGVGKSTLINSFLYVTSDYNTWMHYAPEGYMNAPTKTLTRKAFELTKYLAVVDNRGMPDFSGGVITEVGRQLGGLRKDGEFVDWQPGRFKMMRQMFIRANDKFKIHCAVVVFRGNGVIVSRGRESDLTELVDVIKEKTGQPPIIIITHKDQGSTELRRFYEVLHNLGIDYTYKIENYTSDNHGYSEEKHEQLLEILKTCLLVADKSMDRTNVPTNDRGGCTLL